jgi:hypothetical protein
VTTTTLRFSGALTLAALAVLGPRAQGQRVGYLPSNVGVLGAAQTIPPWLNGYNPYTPAVANSNPASVPLAASGYNPYALSTAGGYNPYLGAAAAAAASPYSLSTAPGSPFGGYGPAGYGISYPAEAGPGLGYGAALQGLAGYTRAEGKYRGEVQSARITREQSRQAALETQKRRIQFEQWYDSVRPTAPGMIAAERAAEVELARTRPGEAEVLSGRALNVLLKSIQSAGSLDRGPNVGLAESTLEHVNVTGGTSAGNVGLLKDGVKLAWPETLQEARFATVSKRLTRNLQLAVSTLKDHEPVPSATMKDVRGDFRALNDKLNESADDLSPSQYIEARRFLNQLGASIKALADPRAANYFDDAWKARGKNVAELVAHLTWEGLTFAPAAPGDEPGYRALYQALRAFEGGLYAVQK